MAEQKRKRGAPKGNQNARKHGYYARVVTDEDRYYLKKAAEVSGIDQEINLVRAKLRSVVQHDPDNIKLILQAVTSLARLIRTRTSTGEDKRARFRQARDNFIRKSAAQFEPELGQIILQQYEENKRRSPY